MCAVRIWCATFGLLGASIAAPQLQAQQVTIGVPEFTVSDGYWEFIGGRWRYFGPGFGIGAGDVSGPTFGGFDPNAGLSTGFAFGGNGTGGQFNFSAGAGRSTVVTSTTPLLTVTNGVPGSLFIGRQVPAVVGVIPVTGFNPALSPAFTNLGPANTVAGRLQRGEFHLRDGQVAPGPDPRRLPPPELAAPIQPLAAVAAGGQPDTVAAVSDPPPVPAPTAASPTQELWQKGQTLEAAGKAGAARLLYQTALRTATGELRTQLEARLQALR